MLTMNTKLPAIFHYVSHAFRLQIPPCFWPPVVPIRYEVPSFLIDFSYLLCLAGGSRSLQKPASGQSGAGVP